MTAVMTSSNDVAPPPSQAVERLQPLRPMPIHEVQRAMEEYQRGLQALLVDSDWQTFVDRDRRERKFVKRSGWRKIATWFGLDMYVGEIVVDRDEHGRLLRARVTARAVAPNGRVYEDVGACDHTERRFSKPEHDIIATATTRAHNRATSDLVGMGEVSGEELLEPELSHELELPEWAEVAPVERREQMAQRLEQLLGPDRARTLFNALSDRYDGVPNVVTGVVTALHSMLTNTPVPTPPPAREE